MRPEGGLGTHYVSVGRDVPPKGVQLSETVSEGGIFHCTNSGNGLKYTYLERVSACLERGC